MSHLYCDSFIKRKKLLDELGKLPEAIVENQECLYLLEEDTRHSLSIEGYFATEEELKFNFYDIQSFNLSKNDNRK